MSSISDSDHHSGSSQTDQKNERLQDNTPLQPGSANGWREQWWRIVDMKIGVVPVPIYILLFVLIAAFAATGKVPSDLTMSIAILSFGGFFFMQLGRWLPWLGMMGGAAILSFVVPSAMVFYGLIPPPVAEAIDSFVKSSNFLYMYIAAIIVGSILSMDRSVLIAGFFKIFVPLAISSITAMLVGTLVGVIMGMTVEHSLFFVVLPIMAGGLGEGAIPLSMGYSGVLSQPQNEIFAQIIPVVMLGSFTAVVICGLLNVLGKRYPHLTGEGRLQAGLLNIDINGKKPGEQPVDRAMIATAGVTIVTFYLVGVLAQRLLDFPAPITMLFLVVIAKLGQLVSPSLEDGGREVYAFFSRIVTWPLLFAMGISYTPWQSFISAFTLQTVVTVVSTVLTLIGTGFLSARLVKMFPIDVAVVVGCHSGQGGTGDIAILTAANRMSLMPFSQIATRIGGAITVTCAILAFQHLV
ncbi:2-hydroxycarboxylate transporter family protein [Agrobacterium vitis]|uniref:2-hydroxycarboxylate transporter family protein n=1 Tax=Agrobacterium vitis TaxID=373 RepID=UPI0020365E6A|nr:2-hydroxycarboxylate transporter family protein [Agrobacterium vitis]MCM2452704.1 2-hydroxycarboxylate transporter family protein [Agrobacterium vitis]